MTCVYLAGPINGCTDEECNDWRSLVKDALAGTDIFTLDPMRRDYRGREDECVNEIVEGDKDDIDISDIIIASCPKPSVGTSMEIFLSWTLGKTVVSVVPEGSVVSPWLRYHSALVVPTFAEAIEYIQKYGQSLA